jgi:glycosyltransferase involved in cell wall biosynthesis
VIPGLPKGKLHLQPVKEAIALFRHQKLGQPNDDVFYPRNKAFQQQLPQRLIDAADVVIGFDTSSWILAERCRKAGKPFVLDASIAHPLAKEKVYEQLRRQYPEWVKEIAPKKPHLIEAELREIDAASHIVVASAFTKKTYTDHGVAPEKMSVIPYGTDLKNPNKQIPNSKGEIPLVQIPNPKLPPSGGIEGGLQIPNSKGGTGTFLEFGTLPTGRQVSELKFLFFGSLYARKGFPLLCRVWETFYRRYPHCRLVVAGHDFRPAGFPFPEGVQFLGPVHPADRAALFASADVFVFPSFFEGFAQVILEAMVCGLPVITTTATAGPDLFGTADCGRIIEPGNEEELLQALAFFAENPGIIPQMGNAAMAAATPFTWQAYGENWVRVLKGIYDL